MTVQTLSDIQSRATQNGADASIDFGNGDVITLKNVTAAALVAGDFSHFWVYLAGPFTGAVAAVGLAALLRGGGGGIVRRVRWTATRAT